MAPRRSAAGTLHPPAPVAFDPATAALVRLSARITAGTEDAVREGLTECRDARVPERWVEELVLQSYLFAGFPRALNAAREWRRASGSATLPGGASADAANGSAATETYADTYGWRLRGEETCAVVYGRSYDKLRANIRRLHPTLDEWMIVEGYGKVLSREGLDLGRRELCIVAACAAAAQDRQLHSHLLGARNAGVADGIIEASIGALAGIVAESTLERARLLWLRVKGK